jgi:precorrin-6x reductase
VVESSPKSQEVWTLSIDPTHPHAQDLFDRAGVSIDRARFPVVTFYRHNVLLNGDELERVLGEANRTFDPVNMQVQREDWYPLWLESSIEASTMRSVRPGVRREPDVIVLNTGPHWQKHVMATPNLGEAEFKAAFQKMVGKG